MVASDERDRIKAGTAAVMRASRAVSEIVSAMRADALEGDSLRMGVSTGQYISAERDLEGALALVRECRRSIEGRAE